MFFILLCNHPFTEWDVLCNCPQCGLIQPNLIVILLMIGQVEDKLFDMRRIYSMHGWFGGVLCPDNPTLSGVESQKRQSCPLPENPNKKRHLGHVQFFGRLERCGIKDPSFKSHWGLRSKDS